MISKLQYDENYNFESEREEEIMFIEFRKELKVLFDAIAQVVRYLELHLNLWALRICIGSIVGFANITKLVVGCFG